MNLLVGNRISFIKPFVEKGIKVDLVLTRKNTRLEEYAIANGIPTCIYFSKNDFFENLREISFKRLYSAGCQYIIPKEILNDPSKTFINIHPSKLPFFPGPHAITEALYRGGPFGVTVHTMGIEVDSGFLISQEEIEFPTYLLTTEKYTKIFSLELELIEKLLIDDSLFRESSCYSNFAKISPANSGFLRNMAFRHLNNNISCSEAKLRIEILSVEGHFSFVEIGKKRMFISNSIDPSAKENNIDSSGCIDFNFSDGTLLLRVIHQELIV